MTLNLENTRLENCEIEFNNGRWLINKKRYNECNIIEKLAFDEFINNQKN